MIIISIAQGLELSIVNKQHKYKFIEILKCLWHKNKTEKEREKKTTKMKLQKFAKSTK